MVQMQRPFPVNYEINEDLGFYGSSRLEDNVVAGEFCYLVAYSGKGLWIAE
jgi:hypothetical protein